MKTMKSSDVVCMMTESNLFMKTDYTFPEYTNELLKFQDLLAQLVLGEAEGTGARMNEVIDRFESMARANGLSWNPDVKKGIQSMKTINKEIAICMAGQNGENRIAHSISFAERSEISNYRNIYVSDSNDETELDSVVLTGNGLILFEIKNVKEDITISPEGRLVHPNGESYDDKSIGDKMELKRRLLKSQVESAMQSQNITLPVCIESYIVFSTPKMRLSTSMINFTKKSIALREHFHGLLMDLQVMFNIPKESLPNSAIL